MIFAHNKELSRNIIYATLFIQLQNWLNNFGFSCVTKILCSVIDIYLILMMEVAARDWFIDVFWVINKIITERAADFCGVSCWDSIHNELFWSDFLFFPIKLLKTFEFIFISVLRELSRLTKYSSPAVLNNKRSFFSLKFYTHCSLINHFLKA